MKKLPFLFTGIIALFILQIAMYAMLSHNIRQTEQRVIEQSHRHTVQLETLRQKVEAQ